MFGITPFGMFHTVIALIAVAAGFTALAKYREIAIATPRAGSMSCSPS